MPLFKTGLDPAGHWHGGPDPCPICYGLKPELQGPTYKADREAWREAKRAQPPSPEDQKLMDQAAYVGVLREHFEAQRRQEEARRTVKKHPWLSIVPPPFCFARVANIARYDLDVADQIEVLAEAPGPVVILGDVGVGKSMAAGALARIYNLRGQSVKWWRTGDLLDAMRGDFGPGGQSEIVTLEAMRVDVLVLDDVDAARQTDFVSDRLTKIADERYNRGLTTISTSNANPSALADYLGDRLYSRLIKAAGDRAIRYRGEDKRGKKLPLEVPEDLIAKDVEAPCPHGCDGYTNRVLWDEDTGHLMSMACPVHRPEQHARQMAGDFELVRG